MSFLFLLSYSFYTLLLLVVAAILFAVWWRISSQNLAKRFLHNNQPLKRLDYNYFYVHPRKIQFKDLQAKSAISWLFGVPALVTIDLDLLKEVLFAPAENFTRITFVPDDKMLVASEGELAKRRRSTVSKVFQTSLLEYAVRVINQSTREELPEPKNNVVVISNVKDWVEKLVTKTVAIVTYGTKSKKELEEIMEAEQIFADRSLSNFLYVYFPAAINLPLKSAKRQRRRMQIFKKLENRMSELKKKFENDEYDESMDNEDPSFLLSLIKITTREKIPFTNEEVSSNCISLGAGGNDSTSSAVVSVLYFLAKYPEYQQAVSNEVKSFIESENYPEQELKLSSLNKLQLTSQVIKESLRLHPPFASTFVRKANKPLHLGDYFIPKGGRVECAISKVQVSELYWEDPLKFDPARFEPEANKNLHPCVFMPFGAGPRHCVAQRFAMIICKLVVLQILSKYTIEYKEDVKFDYEFFMMTPTTPLTLILKRK